MATMSIGKAWEETVAFVAREAALLFPVVLLFVALPGLVLQEMTPPELQAWFAKPNMDAIPAMPPGFGLAMLLTVILVWFGSLALFALALRPGISVGEALRLSLARLPVLLGTAALVVVAFVIGMIAIALVGGLVASLSKAAGALIGLIAGTAAIGGMIYASIRLVLLNPVVIDGRGGVRESLRRAWALTQGHFWRLLGFIIIIMLLSAVAASAAQLVFGLLGSLVGGAEDARLAGGIAGAIVSSIVQVYMLVMLARLYRQAAG
ncbi:MAG: glycerophosphoryl diester phosphodiesterase membrane domain-containing protein [Sphingobium sp.]|uniref:glycerophosphoryl diester phosphodiesterase membrane domain-containing protein n=1 Tax=Sphingobium sp. TaxID=1912891 RepID=UPI002E1C3AAF